MPTSKFMNWKSFVPAWTVFAVMLIASAYYWDQLPASIPTHFDLNGKPDSYSDRSVAAALIPLIYFFLLTTLPFLIRLSPKKFQVSSNQTWIPHTLTATGLLFICIHVGVLANAKDPGQMPPALFLSYGLGLFMLALGFTLEKIERNYFIGFRTPWSMASEKNWKATHLFGSKVMLATGSFTLISTFLATPSLVIAVSSLIFAAIIPVFYSLWYYQNVEKPVESK